MAKEKKKKKEKKSKKSKELYPAKPRDVTIKMRIANKQDFIEFDRYLDGERKKFKVKYGVTFWLINKKGDVENDPYVLTEDTDKGHFAEWLIREQILIPVRRFE